MINRINIILWRKLSSPFLSMRGYIFILVAFSLLLDNAFWRWACHPWWHPSVSPPPFMKFDVRPLWCFLRGCISFLPEWAVLRSFLRWLQFSNSHTIRPFCRRAVANSSLSVPLSHFNYYTIQRIVLSILRIQLRWRQSSLWHFYFWCSLCW